MFPDASADAVSFRVLLHAGQRRRTAPGRLAVDQGPLVSRSLAHSAHRHRDYDVPDSEERAPGGHRSGTAKDDADHDSPYARADQLEPCGGGPVFLWPSIASRTA